MIIECLQCGISSERANDDGSPRSTCRVCGGSYARPAPCTLPFLPVQLFRIGFADGPNGQNEIPLTGREDEITDVLSWLTSVFGSVKVKSHGPAPRRTATNFDSAELKEARMGAGVLGAMMTMTKLRHLKANEIVSFVWRAYDIMEHVSERKK